MANADTQVTVCTPSMHLITFLMVSEMISATDTSIKIKQISSYNQNESNQLEEKCISASVKKEPQKTKNFPHEGT